MLYFELDNQRSSAPDKLNEVNVDKGSCISLCRLWDNITNGTKKKKSNHFGALGACYPQVFYITDIWQNCYSVILSEVFAALFLVTESLTYQVL